MTFYLLTTSRSCQIVLIARKSSCKKTSMEVLYAIDLANVEQTLLSQMQKHLDRTDDASEDRGFLGKFLLLPYSSQRLIFYALLRHGASKRVPSLCGTPPYPFLDGENELVNLSASGLSNGRINIATQSDIPSRRFFGKQFTDEEGRTYRFRQEFERIGVMTLFVLLPNRRDYQFPSTDDQLNLTPTSGFRQLTGVTEAVKLRVTGVRSEEKLVLTAAVQAVAVA